MNQDLKVQAQAMRACADAVESSANAFAQVQELRAQAAHLEAQADALEKQAHDSLASTGCYRSMASNPPETVPHAAASAASAPVPALAWDGTKFVEAA